jgi:hypothetical protein
LNMDASALPPCLGQDEPETPSACNGCAAKELCKYVRANFVAKNKLMPVLSKLEKIIEAAGGR